MPVFLEAVHRLHQSPSASQRRWQFFVYPENWWAANSWRASGPLLHTDSPLRLTSENLIQMTSSFFSLLPIVTFLVSFPTGLLPQPGPPRIPHPLLHTQTHTNSLSLLLCNLPIVSTCLSLVYTSSRPAIRSLLNLRRVLVACAAKLKVKRAKIKKWVGRYGRRWWWWWAPGQPAPADQ